MGDALAILLAALRVGLRVAHVRPKAVEDLELAERLALVDVCPVSLGATRRPGKRQHPRPVTQQGATEDCSVADMVRIGGWAAMLMVYLETLPFRLR